MAKSVGPKVHYRVSGGVDIDHPVFGRTCTRSWIACGTRRALRADPDKAKVTCGRCLDAIKREGF